MKLLADMRQNNTLDLQAVLDHLPYTRFMGIRVEQRGTEITTIMPFDDKLVGNTNLPAIHGGAIGSFLEITAVIQLLAETSIERFPKTVDISVDYLRSGKPVDTYGTAIVTRLGRRVANVRCELWQEERLKPIAASHGQFLL
ncbi:MAG: PaaI family thioesterase [Pseudomonadales bacterium]|jgi:uncharacterized protein (TIGR00369 family)|nr:PaaI family thioesterase [Pseudomonadales bacterium]MDG1444571.1 PaaI family thioesterase [Pseudomonadales bacterium]